MLEEHALFATPVPVPVELARAAKEKDWPDGLLQRALDARMPRDLLAQWLGDRGPSIQQVITVVESQERLVAGPVRFREATWRDAEGLVDLYLESPEDVGELEVIVERGPNPFAQFRLQEHANLQVLECRGVLLAAAAHAARNTLIGGQRLTAHVMSAWRVRRDFRGYGLSRLLQAADPPGASSWFGVITYWYERSGNASQGWLDKIRGEADGRSEHKVAGLSATVHGVDSVPDDGSPPGVRIRATQPADLAACVDLVNATHDGLDLFRPYSVEFLESRLDDPSWGPKPSFWWPVYGWGNHFVAEREGRVVACGGLWDRGRDIRERWRHKGTGDEKVVSTAALLDWGYAAGHADTIAYLVRRLAARTGELGRDRLLAPLEFAPEVRDRLPSADVVEETRALRCMGFEEPNLKVRADVVRPYTDLAYW